LSVVSKGCQPSADVSQPVSYNLQSYQLPDAGCQLGCQVSGVGC
jgi:hypothetical protein